MGVAHTSNYATNTRSIGAAVEKSQEFLSQQQIDGKTREVRGDRFLRQNELGVTPKDLRTAQPALLPPTALAGSKPTDTMNVIQIARRRVGRDPVLFPICS